MPNIVRDQTIYIPTGNPDTMNVTELLRPGELGKMFDYNDRVYQVVKLDSGCTAATGTGVVAANQLAFWKDRSKYLVTNNSPQALFNDVANSYRNNVAGIFRYAATAGNYCCVLKKGRAITVKDDNSSTAGMTLVAKASSVAAEVAGIAINSAATSQIVGYALASSDTSTVSANVDLLDTP